MLFFVDVEVNAKDMGLDQLWDLWDKEVDAALAGMEAGLIKGLYKVAGQRRAIAVLDVPDHDTLDRVLMAGLPMSDYLRWKEIVPIREYTDFGKDIKARWQG
jgi:muconolactone delta-isomerase